MFYTYALRGVVRQPEGDEPFYNEKMEIFVSVKVEKKCNLTYIYKPFQNYAQFNST